MVPFLGFLFGSVILNGQLLRLNEKGYFEARGVNILVYSNQYTGFFSMKRLRELKSYNRE